MQNKEIPIVLSSDNNYAKYMYVTILSIIKNKSPETNYDFYLLVTDNFKDEYANLYKKITKKNPSIKFNIIKMGTAFNQYQDMNIPHITYPTYYRLKMPEILKNYDKAIYLDTDIIVEKDLSELYNIDIANNYIAGVKAAHWILEQPNKEYYSENGLNDLSKYINAGVTLWNLKKIREDKLDTTICDMVKYNYQVQDQDIINIAFKDGIKNIALEYNLMIKYPELFKPKSDKYKDFVSVYGKNEILSATKSPIIIHFADKTKPWNGYCKFLYKWWYYAFKSPYILSFLTFLIEKNIFNKEIQ